MTLNQRILPLTLLTLLLLNGEASAQRLRSDTVSVVKVSVSESSYYRISLYGDSGLIIDSIFSLDRELQVYEIEPSFNDWSTFHIYFKQGYPNPDGRFVIQSNSPESPDTIVYRLDTTNRSTVLRTTHYSRDAGQLSEQITGIAYDGRNIFIQSLQEKWQDASSIAIYKQQSQQQPKQIIEFDSKKPAQNRAWGVGAASDGSLNSVLTVYDTVSFKSVLMSLDTTGEVKASRLLDPVIKARVGNNGRPLISCVRPARIYEYPKSFYTEYGPGITLTSGSKWLDQDGNGHYVDGGQGYRIGKGSAFEILSAIDSMGDLYLISRRDIGNGSIDASGLAFDTVFQTTRNTRYFLRGLRNLRGIEVSSEGDLYVLEDNTVSKYDREGSFARRIQIQEGGSIAVSPSGTLFSYKADSALIIQRFDPKGKQVMRGEYALPPLQDLAVKEVQITRDGQMYLLMTSDADVVITHFDSSGVLLASAHLDGGSLRQDDAVQFLRTDSTVIVAVNSRNAFEKYEGTLYELSWEHAPTAALSVKPRLEAHELRIHPNPASNVLNCSTETAIESVRVYDALGSSWLRLSNVTAPIDVSHLPIGIYTVEVSTPVGRSRAKLVIQR